MEQILESEQKKEKAEKGEAPPEIEGKVAKNEVNRMMGRLGEVEEREWLAWIWKAGMDMRREWEEVNEESRTEQQEKRNRIFLELIDKWRSERLELETKTWKQQIEEEERKEIEENLKKT